MRILHVTMTSYQRGEKQASALKKLGHNVGMVFLGQRMNAHPDYFDIIINAMNENHLINAIQDFKPDIIHTHNYPDQPYWQTRLALKKSGHVCPIVHDVHDPCLTWYNCETPDEVVSVVGERGIEPADGLLFPSQKLLDDVKAHYNFTQHAITFEPYVPKEWYVSGNVNVDFRTLVYEGGLRGSGAEPQYQFRNYTMLADQLKRDGVKFVVYGSPPEGEKKEYENICELKNPLFINNAIKEMAQYGFGFCGSVYYMYNIDYCSPNKLYEYMAAGLPLINMRSSSTAKFIDENKIGFNVNSVEEVSAILRNVTQEQYKQLRDNVFLVRDKYCVENNIQRIINFYEKILER